MPVDSHRQVVWRIADQVPGPSAAGLGLAQDLVVPPDLGCEHLPLQLMRRVFHLHEPRPRGGRIHLPGKRAVLVPARGE